MIVDAHAHLVAPPELYVYKANLQSNHGAHGKGSPGISDERLKQSADENVAIMD
ncbi:MAG: amidohydrolase, partial [Frankiales bacterium]|nr:amidohydrolase [Frankiales bacterium]